MVDDWRVRWQQGYLPFLYVQLANFQPRPDAPVRYDAWAAFRDAQTAALSAIPCSGMACTIDIGDAEDIHPRNKQDVAHRLYGIARARIYAPDSATVCEGPMFEKADVAGDRIRISFKHAQGLHGVEGDSRLKGFAVEAGVANSIGQRPRSRVKPWWSESRKGSLPCEYSTPGVAIPRFRSTMGPGCRHCLSTSRWNSGPCGPDEKERDPSSGRIPFLMRDDPGYRHS